MSKAVLISIRPKWVENIANVEKTIEVRKTRPKLETVQTGKSARLTARSLESLLVT